VKIKDRVCRISLNEKGLLRHHFDDSSTEAGVRKKGRWVECRIIHISCEHRTSFKAIRGRGVDCGGSIEIHGGSASKKQKQGKLRDLAPTAHGASCTFRSLHEVCRKINTPGIGDAANNEWLCRGNP
jgi:hypothetical protein